MSNYRALILPAALALLSGCGAGGGGGGGDSASSSAAAPTPSTNSVATAAQNVQAISVDAGPANNINLLLTSVTVYQPGSSSNCQTIDNILVDTGSSGLRIMSSVLSISLPQQTDASGRPVIECAQFADGFSWGPVKTADLKMSGERANSLSIQVIGDPAFATVPAGCASTGPSRNTVQAFGANGLLGVSAFREDRGSACAQSASPGIYYACPSSGCQPVVVPLAQQVHNPVAMFASDNNGVVIELPSISPGGAASVSGSLVFGIGTQANNALGSALVIALNSTTGRITTFYNSRILTASFIDSGSNALFFQDSSIPTCTRASSAGFYCPLPH